jgi:hypothetical protein
MRARLSYKYDGVNNKRGWDNKGEHYLNPANSVRYSWKFRLLNLSLLQKDPDNIKPSSAAVIGQFHSQSVDCGPYETGYSPAPGLDVRVNAAPDGSGDRVYFKLFTKLKLSQVPVGLPVCTSEPCEVVLWEGDYPISAVSRADSADTHIPPWFEVSFLMRNSQANGAFKFYFGVKDSGDPNLEYQVRMLNGANASTKVLQMPMTQNNCPNVPFLGEYALGYSSKYYGRASGDNPNSDPVRPDSVWRHQRLLANARYMSYVNGTWPDSDPPPQLIVDYDDFRIVQIAPLP